MEATKTVQKLRKVLYLKAAERVDPMFRRDSEAVKVARDHFTNERFGKTYKEMDEDELVNAIHELDQIDSAANAYPSHGQLSLLRFYQMNCALVYANFKNAMFKDAITNDILSGDELRVLLRVMLDNKEGFPKNIYRWLFEEWINPTSHKFLIEGGLRRFTRNASRIYYERLKSSEVNYLIKRYSAIYVNLYEKSTIPSTN